MDKKRKITEEMERMDKYDKEISKFVEMEEKTSLPEPEEIESEGRTITVYLREKISESSLSLITDNINEFCDEIGIEISVDIN